MSTSFHSQLASIMDILAKAAMAEICELVDNGYAVLQLEISRSRKENKALKRKLQMMELRVARRPDDRIFLPRWASRCAKSAPICDELNQTTSRMDKYFPTNVGENEGLMDPGDSASLSAGDQSQDEEQISPDPLLIKIEEQEEDFENSKPHEEVNINEKRAVVPDGGETVPIADTLTENEMSIEKLAELHRTGHTVMEEDTMGTVLKAEQDNENGNLQSAGGRVNALGSKYAWHEKSGSLDTFFAQNTIQTEAEGIAHSYSVETNQENMYIDSEIKLPSTVKKDLSTSDSDEMKAVIVTRGALESGSSKLGFDLSSSLSREAASGAVLEQSRYCQDNFESGAQQDVEVMSMCSSESPLSIIRNTNSEVPDVMGHASREIHFLESGSITTSRRVDAREKEFLCLYCQKSFICLKNLEIHQRVHTGEKPFGCMQCGKRFSQSAYLRKHFIVHTGKKPFSCAKCGKCFSDSSNFKRHQYVHTGERPFRCIQCGKRFSFLGNLKRHQSIHVGKKPSGHTSWEDFIHSQSS